MLLLSTSCFLLSMIQLVASDCAPNDSTNTQEHCVHVENIQATWQEAENFCHAHNGHLASIHNAFDNTLLRNVGSACGSYWLGAKCQAGTSCTWSDGTQFDYNNFRNGQAGVGCVVADPKSGIWTSQDCASTSCIACEMSAVMTDCQDWMNAGYTDSGKYTIFVNGDEHQVYCDMQTYGGGWTVFQRRNDDSTYFWNRTWSEYKTGFGNGLEEDKNFWLSLDVISALTLKDKDVTLRVEMHGDRSPNSKETNEFWYNHYTKFTVGSEANNYPLNVYLDWQNIVGNASTGWYDITYSNGAPFSTIDKNNDPDKDCVNKYQQGGWWLHYCTLATLNGAYTPKDWNNGYGMFWIIDGNDEVIHPRKTTMMLRPTK